MNNLKKTGFVVFIMSISLLLLWSDKKEFTNLKGNYLGQELPGDQPVIFAPEVVSNPKTIEYAGVFSPDQNSFYFTRRDKIRSDQRIWFTEKINGRWTVPEKFAPAQSYMSYEPVFSPDGKTLYFGSQRPFKDKPESEKLTFFWSLTKSGNEWSKPGLLPESISNELPSYISIAAGGSIYFGSYKHPGIMKYEKKRGKCTPMTEAISRFPGAGHPYIAPDESFLILDSNQASDNYGAFDLYISFPKKDGNWTNPLNLGKNINSPAAELSASLTPDGKYLFFNRWGRDGSDIYWVDSSIIKKLRSQAIK